MFGSPDAGPSSYATTRIVDAREGAIVKIAGVLRLIDRDLRSPLANEPCAAYAVRIYPAYGAPDSPPILTQKADPAAMINEFRAREFEIDDGSGRARVKVQHLAGSLSGQIWPRADFERLKPLLEQHGRRQEASKAYEKHEPMPTAFEGCLRDGLRVEALGEAHWEIEASVDVPSTRPRLLVLRAPANDFVVVREAENTTAAAIDDDDRSFVPFVLACVFGPLIGALFGRADLHPWSWQWHLAERIFLAAVVPWTLAVPHLYRTWRRREFSNMAGMAMIAVLAAATAYAAAADLLLGPVSENATVVRAERVAGVDEDAPKSEWPVKTIFADGREFTDDLLVPPAPGPVTLRVLRYTGEVLEIEGSPRRFVPIVGSPAFMAKLWAGLGIVAGLLYMHRRRGAYLRGALQSRNDGSWVRGRLVDDFHVHLAFDDVSSEDSDPDPEQVTVFGWTRPSVTLESEAGGRFEVDLRHAWYGGRMPPWASVRGGGHDAFLSSLKELGYEEIDAQANGAKTVLSRRLWERPSRWFRKAVPRDIEVFGRVNDGRVEAPAWRRPVVVVAARETTREAALEQLAAVSNDLKATVWVLPTVYAIVVVVMTFLWVLQLPGPPISIDDHDHGRLTAPAR